MADSIIGNEPIDWNLMKTILFEEEDLKLAIIFTLMLTEFVVHQISSADLRGSVFSFC